MVCLNYQSNLFFSSVQTHIDVKFLIINPDIEYQHIIWECLVSSFKLYNVPVKKYHQIFMIDGEYHNNTYNIVLLNFQKLNPFLQILIKFFFQL